MKYMNYSLINEFCMLQVLCSTIMNKRCMGRYFIDEDSIWHDPINITQNKYTNLIPFVTLKKLYFVELYTWYHNLFISVGINFISERILGKWFSNWKFWEKFLKYSFWNENKTLHFLEQHSPLVFKTAIFRQLLFFNEIKTYCVSLNNPGHLSWMQLTSENWHFLMKSKHMFPWITLAISLQSS